MSQSFNTTIGLSANASSAGQPVDFDAPYVSSVAIANNSGASIQYSLDAGATWATVATGVTARPTVTAPAAFRLRKTAADSYPVQVGLSWVGDDERGSLSFPDLMRRGVKLGAIGNSIVASPNAFWRFAATASQGLIAQGKSSAVGGSKSSEIVAQVDSLDDNCNAVLIMEGTNDAAQGVSVASHVANMRAAIGVIKARGFVPLLIATPPNDGAYAAECNRMALADRVLAESEGVTFVDPWGRLTDTDGTWTAGATSDGTHPVVASDAAAGADLWSALSAGESGYLLPRSNAGQGLVGSNVLQLTDSNADGLPDGWSNLSVTAPTYSLAAAAHPFRGNRCSVGVSQSSTGSIIRIVPLGGAAVGDVVRITGFISLESSSNMRVRVFTRFNGASVDFTCALILGNTANRFFSAEMKVPSGTTDFRFFIECAGQVSGAFSGTVGFGGFDIYNITQNTY